MKIKIKRKEVRFGVVGAINTFVDFTSLFALSSFGLPVIAANLISTTVALVVSFSLNKNFVFKGVGGHFRQQIGLFILTTLFGLWILQPIIFLAIDRWVFFDTDSSSVTLLFSKICATFVTLIWNYITYSRIVFRSANPT